MNKYFEIKEVNKPPDLDSRPPEIDHDNLVITLTAPMTPLALTGYLFDHWAQFYDVDVGTPHPVERPSETEVALIGGWRLAEKHLLSKNTLLLKPVRVIQRTVHAGPEPEPEPKKSLWQRIKDWF